MDQTIVTSNQERQWHMFCHLSALAGYLVPMGWVLGPLIVWQLKKHEMPSIDAHGREALNFQLSMLIWFVLALITIFIGIGILLLPLLGLLHVIFTVIAGIKANDGVLYKYPMTIRFL